MDESEHGLSFALERGFFGNQNLKFAGPGRQPGGFLFWPKESHIKKGPENRRSPYKDARLVGARDHCHRATRTVGAASAAFANGGG
jgi:hypothetical protein